MIYNKLSCGPIFLLCNFNVIVLVNVMFNFYLDGHSSSNMTVTLNYSANVGEQIVFI